MADDRQLSHSIDYEIRLYFLKCPVLKLTSTLHIAIKLIILR